jgi:molecular chaperone DnaK
MERLNQAQYKAGESMYRQASQAGQPGPGSAPPPPGGEASGRDSGGGDVIDAEVVEEDKK